MAQVFIPITQASQPTGGGCSSAASCPSASSACSSGGCSSENDPEFLLQQQGFMRRTTIGEPRLSEVVENYKAMGYEVHVEYFADADNNAADGSACTTCFDAADKSDAKQVWGTVYVRRGAPTEMYPFNPNGSAGGLTAVTTADGRFTAMMPHPERVFRNIQMSWTPLNPSEFSPWMQLWRNARRWVG